MIPTNWQKLSLPNYGFGCFAADIPSLMEERCKGVRIQVQKLIFIFESHAELLKLAVNSSKQ